LSGTISTHVLDVAHGHPAVGVPVRLEVLDPTAGWRIVAERVTDADGRVHDLSGAHAVLTASYRLAFRTGEYFEQMGIDAFHPEVVVSFRVADAAQHHHVPLLVSPYGYTTYQGS
jgi:5-hydroxyisourate hydrolase